MIEIGEHSFFDEAALVDRLTDGLRASTREVVFVVGAPLTAPFGEAPGVDDVEGVVGLIRQAFASNLDTARRLDESLLGAENRYQAAFRFLQGHRGQDAANAIIRMAVLSANRDRSGDKRAVSAWSSDRLASLEGNPGSWSLSPGVAALGGLLALPDLPFSPLVVTSNFDPLIEMAIQVAGGRSWRTSLHSDGDFAQSSATGCQVVHIHGFWHGSDTLHTGNQLLQTRPFLQNSLLRYVRNKTVVVVAYGGWQDVFTGALQSLVSDASGYPEVLWTFYEQAPEMTPHLASILGPGLDRNRVTLYGGVDCHSLFPKLLHRWRQLRQPALIQSVRTTPAATPNRPVRLRAFETDRPPNVEVWVGRDAELRALEMSQARVVVICGIGGQGKSTLAARYLRLVEEGSTDHIRWDWRDCKEEGDRIRTQIVAAITRLSRDGPDIGVFAGATDADVVEAFVAMSEAEAEDCVFVLDNVDGYVDLERETFVGILDRLVREFARTGGRSRVIITCRPRIAYDLVAVATVALGGLTIEETVELFERRIGSAKPDTFLIATAHELTDGHAFWLDMIAVQVGRVPGATLEGFIEDIRSDKGSPTGPLHPIWKTLHDRERTVLRAMAETMRPEAEDLIAKVVSGKMNFKNFRRALNQLIRLNLIVVKPERNAPDLYDLHPLVRQFVRRTFNRPERVGFIEIVLAQYGSIVKGISAALGVHLPFPMLERWSHKAELEIEAGRLPEALRTLNGAHDALAGGGHTEEFVRVARKLFRSNYWVAMSRMTHFDEVCGNVILGLHDLDAHADVDDLLKRYELTVGAKTARYIKFCNVRAHVAWSRQLYEEAIEWATKGDDLKRTTHVDTPYDCSHTLALAQRDSGDPEGAIERFVETECLSTCIDPDDNSITSASLLGNVGRCLHLMGRHAEAMVCYRKSAQLLEGDASALRIGNQAFAREWI